MKKIFKLIGIIAIVAIMGFSMIVCNKSGNSGSNSNKSSGGGGKNFNSAEELKEYLDKQPANSPNNPIKVSMGANAPMLPKIAEAINSAGKYVSLNLTGNILTTIAGLSGCEMLVSVIIPDSVTTIGNNAFVDCTNLTSITIPDSVTSIGDDAFSYCSSLTSVTIPDSVTRIGERAFSRCTSLTSVTIPDSVTSIGDEAFSVCESLTSVTIPDSVTSIGISTFEYCTSLTSVTFQGTITWDNFNEDEGYGYYYYDDCIDDLREKYLAGGIGTYTTTAPVNKNSKWTKK